MSKRLTPYQIVRSLVADGYSPRSLLVGLRDLADHEIRQLSEEVDANAAGRRELTAMQRALKKLLSAHHHLSEAVDELK